MLCPACGEQNQNDSRYCSSCGFELTPSLQSKVSGPAASSIPVSSVSAGPSAGSGNGSGAASGIDLNEVNASPSPPQEAGPTAIQPGTVVRDRYRIERLLGQGGMGSVFLSTDTTMNRKLAIKFINPELWQRRAAYLRFIREANVCLDMTHNHIIRVYNLEEWQGQAFLTMEFLDGISLRMLMHQLKKQKGNLDWGRCRSILRQMLEAMEYAHSKGVVHRDLKPGNIMLARDADATHRVVVMDFGLARRDEDDAEAKTRIGSSLGTPEYMAPEQAISAAQVDGRADLFSVGAIAYEMLTGRVPRGKLESPSHLTPGLPDGVDEWVFKALEHDVDARFQSAHEMNTQLKQIGRVRKAIEVAAGSSSTAGGLETPSASDSRPSEMKSHDSSILDMGSTLDDFVSADAILQMTSSASFPEASHVKRKQTPGFILILPMLAKAVVVLGLLALIGWGVFSFFGSLSSNPGPVPVASSTSNNNPADARSPKPSVAGKGYTENFNGLGIEMAWLPGGSFVMGNNATPEDMQRVFQLSPVLINDEYPAKEVQLDGFWISKHEITIKQYQEFLTKAANPNIRGFGPEHPELAGKTLDPDSPVTWVRWRDAEAFSLWLVRITGKYYRLPTEAQWEYACRAGSNAQFCFGELPSKLDEYAWIDSNSAAQTHGVGLKKPNAFDLFDMHGNVMEWCHDFYSDRFYIERERSNPENTSVNQFHVTRGGSFRVGPEYCRSSSRGRQTMDTATDNIGFRIVAVSGLPPEEIAKIDGTNSAKRPGGTGTGRTGSGRGRRVATPAP